MSVNKYQLRIDGKDKYINIPLTLTSTNVGQSDIIENEFVKKETEKAINPIIDHEKIRFRPKQQGTPIDRVDYNINLLKGGAFPGITSYGSEGFENDDIKFKRNNFKRSFLNLTFFDSDTTTNQNYLGNVTIFSKITRFDLKPTQITKPKPTSKPITYQNLEALEANMDNTLDNFLNGGDYNMVHYEETIGEADFSLALNNANTFEPAESCGFTKATYDDGIDTTLSIGHVCTDYLFPRMLKYYVSGLSWKRVVSTGTDYVECSTNGMIGEVTLFSGEEGDIPYGGYFLVKSDYEYQGKTYEIYVEWTENVYTKMSVVTDVYFKCVSGGSGTSDGTTGGATGGGSLLPSIEFGKVQDVNNIPLRFIVENPITTPKGFAEGYYVYHEKTHTPPSIYMRATFNNAKNGLSTDLITTNIPQDIDNVLNKLHMKYDLKFEDDIYYYELDMEYSKNIKMNGKRLVIDLYEIQVL